MVSKIPKIKSPGEETLAFNLKVLKIDVERQYKFFPPRDFAFDFVVLPVERFLAVEVDGGNFTGGHRRYEEADEECVKNNLAMMDGWRVLHFTPAMVESGEALVTIEAFMGKSL